MTTPLQAIDTPNGRYYPRNGIDYVSVTTVIGSLPKDGLTQWAANLAADKALALAKAGNPLDRDAIRFAHEAYRDKAAVMGTAVHALAEANLRGEEVDLTGLPKPVLRRYEQFCRWREAYEVEPLFVEATVFNDTFKYAGSCDLIARVNGVITIIDLKTSRSIHSEVALQLAAYRHADYIIDSGGFAHHIPVITDAAVLHITSNSFSFLRVNIGAPVYDRFLDLVRTRLGWIDSLSERVIGKPVPMSDESMWRLRMGK